MSKEITIGLNLGDGLHTTEDDKLEVYYEPNGNMHLETSDNVDEIGVYVNDLNGADGAGGGSQYDNWTIKSGEGWRTNDSSQTISNFIDVNREVVNLIFTFGLYKVATRHPSTISYGSSVKDVRGICNEIVAPVWYSPSSYTSYRPNPGELIQLVKNPLFRTVPYGSGTIACESGNRASNDSMETAVMFVIMDIHYMSDIQQGGNQYWVHDMTLQCIYSTVSDYVVGQTYSGTQLFDSNNV